MPTKTTNDLRVDVDADWREIARKWTLREGVTYLNHGSFGLPPNVVRDARRHWIDQLDGNPMDFFVRQYESLFESTRNKLAKFLTTDPGNVAFADNATYAMNVVANAFPLTFGDEVLINDHEYGAVERIWQRKCDELGARLAIANLPSIIESEDQVVDAIFDNVTGKTRLIVVSHITSATAITMPIRQIIRRAKEYGIAVCIDGPHALVQEDINLNELDCDFYTASCHKWLCATLGSGFIFAAKKWHSRIEPLNRSWGRLLPNVPERWTHEFDWSGTRDPSALLTIGTAIDFIHEIGIENFRRRSRWLSAHARHRIESEFGTTAITPDAANWYCSMAHVPLPHHQAGYDGLQDKLWKEFGIEVPVIEFNQRWYIRVSSHLYNMSRDTELLVDCLQQCLT